MLKQVDLVVVGRIEAREQRALGTGADATPVINHTVRILDLVKGTAAPGRTITVVQPGGIVVTSGVEMYIDDPFYPVFKAGGEYVLFLWYDDHFKHLTPLYGSAAAFPVIDSKVSIPSRATRVEAFEGKRSFDLVPFVALLRRHVGSR